MERVGVIQMTSGPNVADNVTFIEKQIARLVKHGAQWIVTPENALLFSQRTDYHAYAEPLGRGPIQLRLAEIARHYGVWLLIGSMPIKRDDGVTSTSILLDSQGQCQAYYDKLHMFDVDVADSQHRYRESETFQAGSQISLTQTPFGALGLSICYDIRFPHLYSELRQRGAEIFIVPAAFTAVTGQAHWEVLLRARAIENQCWVVAAAQGGKHPCGRETWGHSMVVNPWGEIVASLEQQAGSLIVDIDRSASAEVRQAMPIIEHARFSNQFQSTKS
ncbi:carbon-nitrogen hydrolase family protein [Vibrio sp. CAIM 722]|uniref:Carbon-nitrogen hydrolase family protein n=1 Tax=Vibrio eleionomae TaxID=2653505 RepID=A0A7X4LIV5_9VIBR|nr:carbon-nitrogen hydrolase family protein [Vibrio eleionomae]MZI92717.1 carbon-nitrogen hydrolase family protein [Vibrio eleionomae]